MLGERLARTETSMSSLKWAPVPARYALAILLTSMVAMWRLPEQARGTLWAEDGVLFLRDAFLPGPTNPFTPYAGYLHVVPRLATEFVTTLLPVDRYGYGMNCAAVLLVAGIAAMVFHCSSAMTTNVVARVAFASITILVAPAPIETLGNLANLHWYFLWLTPWLLMKSANTTPGSAALFLAGLAAALTEPITLLFAPLFLYRIRDHSLWPARAGLGIGMLGQIIATVSAPRPGPGRAVDLLSAWDGWFLHSSAAIVLGTSKAIKEAVLSGGALPIALTTLPFLAAFVFIMVKGSARHRLLAVVFVAASGAVYVAANFANFNPSYDYANFTPAQWQAFYLSRYATPSAMFLLALVPLLAVVVRGRVWRALILGAFVVAQLAYFTPAQANRQLGPDWAGGVENGKATCSANKGATITVPIAPGTMRVQLPCARL